MQCAAGMPSRHDLAWLTPSGWDDVQQASAARPTAVRDAVARWRAADWPLVVRRAEPEQPPGLLAVGLPLPPDDLGDKVRIGALVAQNAVRRHASPLTFNEVAGVMLPQWRTASLALQLAWPEFLTPLRVYGSLAWQALTGMPFLRDGSDIDLLFTPCNRREMEQGTELLDAHGVCLPLDGEILFPGDVAVAWREWRAAMLTGGAGAVLAKRADRVQLVSCQALLLLLALPSGAVVPGMPAAGLPGASPDADGGALPAPAMNTP